QGVLSRRGRRGGRGGVALGLLLVARVGSGLAARGADDLRGPGLRLGARLALLVLLLPLAQAVGLAAPDGGEGPFPVRGGVAVAAAAAAARGRAGARVEAGGGHEQAADLALRGVVDHEALALAVDAIHQAALVSARVERAGRADGQGGDVLLLGWVEDPRLCIGGDLVDAALGAGARVEGAGLAVVGKAPDVGAQVLGEDARLAAGGDADDEPAGAGARVDGAVGGEGQREDLAVGA